MAKKPISQKKMTELVGDLFGDRLGLDRELQEELDKQGLVPRWVNAKKIYESQGYHEKGWVVYRRQSQAKDVLSFKFGNDPDGIVRRGDCILAVKSKEDVERHQAYLAQRADRMKGSAAAKKQAAELRQAAREANVNVTVHEGYEE